MQQVKDLLILGLAVVAGVGSTCGEASADVDSPAATGLQEIVVTATKRSESANKVPISISVLTNDDLVSRGVTSTEDLGKVVPGFTFTQTQYGPPVFTLRGIGFYDTSIGAKPSVSVYEDEVPIPFSIETKGASMDLQRVEVLKGPQGTLFGTNATGGAINYVAAKPTREIEAGVDIGGGTYGAFDASAFVSGPLTETIAARLAFETEQGGGYQYSITRPGDSLGDRNFNAARLLVDFQPIDSFKFELGVNGFIDRNEPLAGQAIAVTPLSAVAASSPLYSIPLSPTNDRQADWSPSARPTADNKFVQLFGRADYHINDNMTITSITAYSHYSANFHIDPDGSALDVVSYQTNGSLRSLSQELRLAGEAISQLHYIVGLNVSQDKTHQYDLGSIPDSSSAPSFEAFGLGPFTSYADVGDQKFNSGAIFGNLDYDINDAFTLHGGARYTRTNIDFAGCSLATDPNLAAGTADLLNFVVRPAAGLPSDVTIPVGTCDTLQTNPNAAGFLAPALVRSRLDEHNVSWRGGLDYKPTDSSLIYFNVSRGYKAGSFPVLPATDSKQFDPATQESVTAYELGEKITLFDRSVQLNGAIFYYDYKDKQFQGRRIGDPNIFGPLTLLVNVPKSRVEGAEVQADFAPMKGLKLSLAGTYLDTKIEGPFEQSDPFGNFINVGGEPFQYTPKFQAQASGQYSWDLTPALGAFAGADAEYRSKTNSSFGLAPEFNITDYTLFNVQGGITTHDGKYRLALYVRNLADKYYWTNSVRVTDTVVRFAGEPRTAGVTFSIRY